MSTCTGFSGVKKTWPIIAAFRGNMAASICWACSKHVQNKNGGNATRKDVDVGGMITLKWISEE
jgi:hypothetical protein